VVAQAFGDGLLLAATSAPRPSDDIDPGVALAAVEAARSDGTAVTFVDTHNCFAEGEGDVQMGDPTVYQLVETSRLAAEDARLLAAEAVTPRLGLAATREMGEDHGIGPGGITVALLEVSRQRSAFVLLDGNNLLPAVRDAARRGALQVADEAEVFTTDNHILNVGGRSSFPAGLAMTPGQTEPLVAGLARKAAADLAAVHVALESGRVPDLRIMGPGAGVRYATYIKASLAIMFPVAVASLLLGLLGTAVFLAWGFRR
jgi:putative membrane protein